MTIAFDGKILASDSHRLLGSESKKLFKALTEWGEALVGIEGSYQDVALFLEYLEAGNPRPKLSKGFEALLVKCDGTVELFDSDVFHYRPKKPMCAIGTGSQYAVGAMYCGKTADVAIEIAIECDVVTQGPVQKAMLVDAEAYNIVQMMGLGAQIAKAMED